MVAWRQNVIVEHQPVLTAARAAAWLVHCALQRPAVIQIEANGPQVQLAPRLRAYGSTSIYMKRLAYEPALDFLASQVGPEHTVLDVGANLGIYALTMSARSGGQAAVHAFEPGVDALRQLRNNAARNRNFPINIIPFGLSDMSQEADLYHVGGPTTFSLGGTHVSGEISETVQLISLDEWATNSVVDRVDVMKVDVEGFEPRVFDGGRATIMASKPLIMFEVSYDALHRAGHAYDSAWRKLSDFGYRIYRYVPVRQGLEPLEEVEEGNLFAVHPSSSWPAKLNLS